MARKGLCDLLPVPCAPSPALLQMFWPPPSGSPGPFSSRWGSPGGQSLEVSTLLWVFSTPAPLGLHDAPHLVGRNRSSLRPPSRSPAARGQHLQPQPAANVYQLKEALLRTLWPFICVAPTGFAIFCSFVTQGRVLCLHHQPQALAQLHPKACCVPVHSHSPSSVCCDPCAQGPCLSVLSAPLCPVQH